MQAIVDFLSPSELDFLHNEVKFFNWDLIASSHETYRGTLPLFWFKSIFDSGIRSIFQKKLQIIFNTEIEVTDLYVNGQAHGQCGFWHTDYPPSAEKKFTMVYFPNEWKPEYGGHLLIKKDDKVHSFLPEQNHGVIFDGTLFHMGLEPTVHCKTQRESIACKFILR